MVTTYPLLVRDAVLAERSYHYLILDEAQTIKNRASKAHRAVREVDATHRLALTGTPLENNTGELHALFEVLSPGLLGSAEAFGHRFRRPIEAGDADRLGDLRRRVKPFMLRRIERVGRHRAPA